VNCRPAGRVCAVVVVDAEPDLTAVAVVGGDHVQTGRRQLLRAVKPERAEAGSISRSEPGDLDRILGVGSKDGGASRVQRGGPERVRGREKAELLRRGDVQING